MSLALRLVFAWGNPSRGDDALGPLLAERLRERALPGTEVLDDFQLQPEHALDLAGRAEVLFVDASLDARAPFEVRDVAPGRDASFSSHHLSPQALLQVCVDVGVPLPPRTRVLAIRGRAFELGAGLSAEAAAHLQAALDWLVAQ